MMKQAVVDGLLSSAFLWIFWTPFLTFIVAPLVQAQMQQGVCNAVRRSVWAYNYNTPGSPVESFVKPYTNPDAIPAVESQVDTTVQKANTFILYSLWMTMLVVVASSFVLSYYLAGGSEFWRALRKNAAFFVIVSIIELTMFASIAMRYNGFDNTAILHGIV